MTYIICRDLQLQFVINWNMSWCYMIEHIFVLFVASFSDAVRRCMFEWFAVKDPSWVWLIFLASRTTPTRWRTSMRQWPMNEWLSRMMAHVSFVSCVHCKQMNLRFYVSRSLSSSPLDSRRQFASGHSRIGRRVHQKGGDGSPLHWTSHVRLR